MLKKHCLIDFYLFFISSRYSKISTNQSKKGDVDNKRREALKLVWRNHDKNFTFLSRHF